MSLDKISLTLYDFLGYLLPGYILVLGASIVESTFLDSDLLTLSRISDNPLPFVILAYLVGVASHSVGSILKAWKFQWFSGKPYYLSDAVFEQVRQTVKDTYNIQPEEGAKISTLETYLMADSYVLASGGCAERDVIMAREGFCKASMVATSFLSLVLIVSMFVSGASIQTLPGSYTNLNLAWTGLLAVTVLVMAFIFRWGMLFYNRVKINNAMLIFLALRAKDRLKENGGK